MEQNKPHPPTPQGYFVYVMPKERKKDYVALRFSCRPVRSNKVYYQSSSQAYIHDKQYRKAQDFKKLTHDEYVFSFKQFYGQDKTKFDAFLKDVQPFPEGTI